jgi:hypothetical protein
MPSLSVRTIHRFATVAGESPLEVLVADGKLRVSYR